MIKLFYRKYCPADARDVMIDYLDGLSKPRKTDPDEHFDRMEELFQYTNKLPGNEPPLTDVQQRKKLLNSFPLSWVRAYRDLGHKYQDEEKQQILAFMRDRIGKSMRMKTMTERNRNVRTDHSLKGGTRTASVEKAEEEGTIEQEG
jgi:hypothetical protein